MDMKKTGLVWVVILMTLISVSVKAEDVPQVEERARGFLKKLGYNLAGEVVCIGAGDKWSCQAKSQGYLTPLIITCTAESCYFVPQARSIACEDLER
jgi:hypothetical protein